MKNQYLSYNQAVALFQGLEKRHPDLIQTENIGRTWERRKILLVTIAVDVRRAEEQPAMLYTGSIHAREWIGIELAAAYARYVVENIELDDGLSAMLRRATLYMVPCLNPDGFELTRSHYSHWRKNRRKNQDGSRGVDLNRNFPIGFKTNNHTTDNTWAGPAPFSEPETQAMRNFVEKHPNIAVALDYHSHGNVFFPAHNFRHEDSPDTTDINVLCANMAEEIRKVSGREYGIHQGKPPASMISGSGREYYHSLGILSTVVEVGVRNISDYMAFMAEHIRENIPALNRALMETPNYARDNPLPRISGFLVKRIRARSVTLYWDPIPGESISYELYRSKRDKHFCLASNRIVVTKAREYTDENLQTATDYYYYVRAISAKHHVKSPFAPRIRLKTLPDNHQFFKILHPAPQDVGSLSEYPVPHPLTFGVNSMFVGVSSSRGVSIGIVGFPLENMPREAIILEAKISLYPVNRVPAKVERYGEWNVGILDPEFLPDFSDFTAVREAPVLQYVGRPTKAQHLTQGIWRSWNFSNYECQLLGRQLEQDKVFFKITGPTTLPEGQKSQMMMWDVGHGKFGYGLAFRPRMEVIYTLPATESILPPSRAVSVHGSDVIPNMILAGLDHKGASFGYLEFDLAGLANFKHTVITGATLSLQAQDIIAADEARFHLEFIKPFKEVDCETVGTRHIIEQIGTEVSYTDLRNGEPCLFFFDTFSLVALDRFFRKSRKAAFIIRATTDDPKRADQVATFVFQPENAMPRLTIHTISKRRQPVAGVGSLQISNEQGVLKLTWENPKDPAFRGVLVVKNPFRPPQSPYDGQKLYGGRDEYTYDRFGALDMTKYYGVFAFDEVPNFSAAAILRYQPPAAQQ